MMDCQFVVVIMIINQESLVFGLLQKQNIYRHVRFFFHFRDSCEINSRKGKSQETQPELLVHGSQITENPSLKNISQIWLEKLQPELF